MAVKQQSQNAITLKGSAKLVMDYLSESLSYISPFRICIPSLNVYIMFFFFHFLDFGINSILFQRGIYPPESFKTEEHFGLSILVSTDEKIQQFLTPVLSQMKGIH